MSLGKTVRQLLAEIDSRELSEWLAFDRIEPLPDPYWMTGMVCSTLANLWAKRRYQPEDFMPRAGPRRREQSPDEGRAILDAMMARQRAQTNSGYGADT